MPTRIDYESTKAPNSIEVGAGKLGKRSDEATLRSAFGTSTGEDAGASRITNDDQEHLLVTAKATMTTYEGGNPMFPQYRRNFVPALATPGATLSPEYTGVRNKTMGTTEINDLKLGTPYSPTIASPGAQNKLNPNNLASVASTVNGVVYSQEGGPLTVALDPDSASHQNRDTDQHVTNIGSVRRFKLGVGSGGADEVAARGQFSNT
jgi:hypothetical protein